MKRIRAVALLLALCLLLSACGGTQTPLERTAKYLKSAVPEPGFGSLDGDWIVFGLARAGADLSDGYFDRYYTAVEAAVQAADGTLDENRYTEYSRLILALTAIGRDPQNVGGYNLLLPLADLEKTTAQGVNGAAFALLALDCGGYELPQNSAAAVQATRDSYVDAILTRHRRRRLEPRRWRVRSRSDRHGPAGACPLPQPRGRVRGSRSRAFLSVADAGGKRRVFLLGHREQRVGQSGAHSTDGAWPLAG